MSATSDITSATLTSLFPVYMFSLSILICFAAIVRESERERERVQCATPLYVPQTDLLPPSCQDAPEASAHSTYCSFSWTGTRLYNAASVPGLDQPDRGTPGAQLAWSDWCSLCLTASFPLLSIHLPILRCDFHTLTGFTVTVSLSFIPSFCLSPLFQFQDTVPALPALLCTTPRIGVVISPFYTEIV